MAAYPLLDDSRYFNLHGTGVFHRRAACGDRSWSGCVTDDVELAGDSCARPEHPMAAGAHTGPLDR